MVLYTDGLIERRGESIDVGFERLRAPSARTRPRRSAGGRSTTWSAGEARTTTS